MTLAPPVKTQKCAFGRFFVPARLLLISPSNLGAIAGMRADVHRVNPCKITAETLLEFGHQSKDDLARR